MATREQWGEALTGMGAWFAGQGPQYMNAMNIKERNRLLEEKMRREEIERHEEERRLAMVSDMYAAIDHYDNGRVNEAGKLWNHRIAMINAFDGDPKHTVGFKQLHDAGMHKELRNELAGLYNRARVEKPHWKLPDLPGVTKGRIIPNSQISDRGEVTYEVSPGVFETHSTGRAPKPDQSRTLTAAQETNNREIDMARRMLEGMDKEEILKRSQEFTALGRANPDYDPFLGAMVRKAMDSKVGEDKEYESIYAKFFGEQGPNQKAPDSQQQADIQAVMNANKGWDQDKAIRYLKSIGRWAE